MSFIRNPKDYDVKRNKTLISKSDINKHLSNLDDILSSHRYFSRSVKSTLESEVEMIAYLLEHPKCTRKINKLKILAKVERKLQNVKGIDTQCLKDLVPKVEILK